MATCVPVRDMKDTAKFSRIVEESAEPVTVTRNGRDAYEVMTSEVYDSIKQDLARMRLYEMVLQAEREREEGAYVEYDAFSRDLRERYGL